MGIVVACRCGQGFEADLDLAGKVVQCPACRSPIAVPTPVTELPVPTHSPRTRTGLSREAREANESLTTILVAGGALLIAVVGISITVVGYLRGTNPLQWITVPQVPSAAENPGAQPDESADGAVLIAAPGRLPEGWGFFDHPEGKFSALLPSSPEISETRIGSLAGTQTIYSMLATRYDHIYEAFCEFRTFTMSRGQEATAYGAVLSKRAGELEEGKIEASNNAMVDGRLVCDAILRGKVEGTEFRKYLRIIAADDWVLELSCRVPPGKEQPADIKLFLGNFKLQ